MIRTIVLFLAWLMVLYCTKSCHTPASEQHTEPESLLQLRADSFELPTAYVAPPGDALSHHASGFAKILCSAVLITGLDFDFAAENIGYFSAPYEARAQFTRELNRANNEVRVTLPNGIVRTARLFGDQGCICLAEGENDIHFEPVTIQSTLPDQSTTEWPLGDLDALVSDAAAVNMDLVQQAVDTNFSDPQALSAAFLVTHKGRIIGERYRAGIDMHTPLESWSMGKSLTATLMGVLLQQGVYDLHQKAPVPEWDNVTDERANITIADILRMSSGLRFRAPQDPDFDPEVGYPDHLYVYTGGANSFTWAATRPPQWPPNTVGRYRNSDPALINYLVRLGVEGRGDEYLSFPQRDLFDKIGVRNMVMETDPYGNLLLQGYEFGTARDWARLGNLYLNDGVSQGERLLPEGFVEFVSTVAPAWQADGRPIYGGLFWINGNEQMPIPKEAYYMAGAGGQLTIIIPSHDLVVVKLTHYKGSGVSRPLLNAALELLMQAVPAS